MENNLIALSKSSSSATASVDELTFDTRQGSPERNMGNTPTKKTATLSYNDVPVRLWAKALECLTMEDVLNCSLVNNFFLQEVSRDVQCLLVRKSSNLVGSAARKRFPAITHVFVYTLIKGCSERKLCIKTCQSLLPFILSFPKIHYLRVPGYCTCQSGDHASVACFPLFGKVRSDRGHRLGADKMEAVLVNAVDQLIRQISEAFASGQLNSRLKIKGAIPCFTVSSGRCVFASVAGHDHDSNGCTTCKLMCRYFPPDRVLSTIHMEKKEVCCVPWVKRAQIVWDCNPNGLKENMDFLLSDMVRSETSTDLPNVGSVMTYTDAQLRRMEWILDKGANINTPKSRGLVHRRRGAKGRLVAGYDENSEEGTLRRLDRRVYHKFREWGMDITESQFQLFDLPT